MKTATSDLDTLAEVWIEDLLHGVRVMVEALGDFGATAWAAWKERA